MLSEIKKHLLNSPEDIKTILEHYDFANVDIQINQIRFGFSEDTNRTSIRIKLVNNENLFVNDFGRNVSCDLFNFIIKSRNLEFKEVIQYIKNLLNITITYEYVEKKSIFGGFYERIKLRKQNKEPLRTYDDNILDSYEKVCNLRFYRDGISFEAQKYFGICYDIESQRIIIPIYNSFGEIIGIKGRANWELGEDDRKYMYLIGGRMSSTLYGYSQNYSYLVDNMICIVESEKSVMQAFTLGYRNFVAVGGNSLSTEQCMLIMELCPKKIIFLFDEGLDKEVIKKDISRLLNYTRMREVQIGYWDWEYSINAGHKDSPTDLGAKVLKDILENEIVYI